MRISKEIKDAHKLLLEGVISEVEFTVIKQKIISENLLDTKVSKKTSLKNETDKSKLPESSVSLNSVRVGDITIKKGGILKNNKTETKVVDIKKINDLTYLFLSDDNGQITKISLEKFESLLVNKKSHTKKDTHGYIYTILAIILILALLSISFIEIIKVGNSNSLSNSNHQLSITNNSGYVEMNDEPPADYNYEDQSTNPKDYLLDISKKSIGDFKLGKRIPFNNLPATFKIRKEIKWGEGASEIPTYIVSENGQDLFVVYPDYDFDKNEYNKVASSIIVLSSKIKLNIGVGVNTTISKFKSKYTDSKIWYTYVSGMYVLETSQINAQFILDYNDYTGYDDEATSDMVYLKYADFKKDAKIIKIRIY